MKSLLVAITAMSTKRKLDVLPPASPKRRSNANMPIMSSSDAQQFWLLKSEPDDYSIDALKREGSTCWDGVRNAVARKNLRLMKLGDECLFYHSSCGKNVGVVGTCRVQRTAYPDPADEKWSVVDVAFSSKLEIPILLPLLKEKKDGKLSGMALFSQPRLSVQPVSTEHYAAMLQMAEELARARGE